MFFRNTHKSNGEQIVSLKIVRQKKVGNRLETKEGTFYSVISNIFLDNPSVSDLPAQSQSLSSLERLGLLHVTYEQWLADDSAYAGFDQTSLYTDLISQFRDDSRGSLIFQKGMATLTPLGENFKQICLG